MKRIIALIQLTSKLDYRENLEKLDLYLQQASTQGARYCFLPECFYSLSNGVAPTPYLVRDIEGDEHLENIRALAVRHGVYLLGGSVALEEDGKILNRCLSFSPQGNIISRYDKNHLFACDLKNKKIDEGNIYTAGCKESFLELDGLRIGQNICFDMRFSEQALSYRRQGANLLTYSSSFTVPTGKAHWHTLLKARAIEGQLFVVAAAQWGEHNERVRTYGHSLVVNPWGDILVDAKEGEGAFCVELDLAEVDLYRSMVLMKRP